MLQNLYPHLLAFHNLLRWVVLAAVLAAILVALSGWSGAKPASPLLLRLGIVFVIAIDLDFLTGLLLYFGASPITRAALSDFGAAMKSFEPRFFAVEHSLLMFLAVICAHAGGIMIRKGRTDQAKCRGAAVAWLFALLFMLIGIPWWRPLIRLAS